MDKRGVGRPLVVVLIAALAPLSALAAGPAPMAVDDRMVSLPDHRKLHLICSGKGAPTVILESGYQADAGGWYKVQPLVARNTRVCSYDRAGMGKSTVGPMPRDGAAIAADIDAALKAAKINGPFVLVGHSAGGLYVRLLAARRVGQVAGLVLVDPSVEYQTRRIDAFYPGAGSIEGLRVNAETCLKAVEAKAKGVNEPALGRCLPGADQPQARALALQPSYWRTQMSEVETLFTTTSDQVANRLVRVKRVPVIILTATPNEGPTADPGDNLHRRLHAELGAQFTTSQRRLVKSSHLMMLDRPEIVDAAIEEMVQAVRRPK